MSLTAEVRKRGTQFLVDVVLLGGLFLTALTAWGNHRTLAEQAQDMTSLTTELSALKQTMVAVLIDDPENADLIRTLVREPGFRQGVMRFNDGQYAAAFSAWEESAMHGTAESVFAIKAAKAKLEQAVADETTPLIERQRMEAALEVAPDVEVQYSDLMYREEDRRAD